MVDQAERLRTMIKSLFSTGRQKGKFSRIIAIASGKGGVGKQSYLMYGDNHGTTGS